MRVNSRFAKIFDTMKQHNAVALIVTILAILASFWIGHSIPNPNPFLLVLVFLVPFTIALTKSKEVGFYLILIWVFFADWFFQLGLIPTQLTWVPEIVLILYIVYFAYTRKKLVSTPIDIPVLFFIAVAIGSAVLNTKDPIAVFFAMRLDLKFILMFYLMVNFDLEERFYKNMIKAITILLIIQIPVASVKFLIYGQGEMAIGTYGAWGGAYSTYIPLIAICLFGSMYLHKKANFMYLLLIFGFILFSIMSGKKGLIYYGPPVLAFVAWRTIKAKSITHKFFRTVVFASVVSLMLLPVIFYVPELSSYMEDYGRDYRDFVYAYDMRYDESGNPAGRLPSILETFRNLISNPGQFLIGYGPGSMIKSFIEKYDTRLSGTAPIRYVYGITELVQKPIEYGYLGFLLYFALSVLLIYRMNEKFYNNIDDDYWRIMSFSFAGIIFAYFILGIFYGVIFRGDLAAFVYWFFAAAIYSMGKKKQIL